MSKNFEIEYKALAACEAPDLWNRIEAGLTPQKAVASEEKNPIAADMVKTDEKVMHESMEIPEGSSVEDRKVYEAVCGTGSGAEDRKVHEAVCGTGSSAVRSDRDSASKKGIVFLQKYKSALIAAVCVLVILPAAVMIHQMEIIGRGAKMESAMESADTAAVVTEETAEATEESTFAAEEAAEEGAFAPEGRLEESAFAEEATGEGAFAPEGKLEESAFAEEKTAMSEEMESAPMETVTEGAAAEKETMAGDSIGNMAEDAVRAESPESGSAEKKQENAQSIEDMQNSLGLADGTVLEHVSIRISGEKVMKEELYPEAGNFYYVEIVKDENGILKKGEEILLFVPESITELTASYEDMAQMEYEIAIAYDSQRQYPFYLKACY